MHHTKNLDKIYKRQHKLMAQTFTNSGFEAGYHL
jgi:hypothetical protein